jgi:hypothetical protein
MGGPDDLSMCAPIYYAVLACSGCSRCSGPEDSKQSEHHALTLPHTVPQSHIVADPALGVWYHVLVLLTTGPGVGEMMFRKDVITRRTLNPVVDKHWWHIGKRATSV